LFSYFFACEDITNQGKVEDPFPKQLLGIPIGKRLTLQDDTHQMYLALFQHDHMNMMMMMMMMTKRRRTTTNHCGFV